MFYHLLIGLAYAQESTDPYDSETLDRPFRMETNVRFRQLMLPDSLMDTWFYDSDTEGAYPEDRPDIRAYVVGVEYVFNQRPGHWIIWGEYIGSMLEEGYWDDVDTGTTVDHDDGDWVRPDNFSGWFLGANYAYEFPVTPQANDVWLSILMGGGLGVGYLSGELSYWRPGSSIADSDSPCEPASPSYVRHSICSEPDGVKDFPRILPMLDITLSAKVNFAERAHIRIDGGLHDMIYYGISTGASF
jgi:hypothetical protein